LFNIAAIVGERNDLTLKNSPHHIHRSCPVVVLQRSCRFLAANLLLETTKDGVEKRELSADPTRQGSRCWIDLETGGCRSLSSWNLRSTKLIDTRHFSEEQCRFSTLLSRFISNCRFFVCCSSSLLSKSSTVHLLYINSVVPSSSSSLCSLQLHVSERCVQLQEAAWVANPMSAW